MYYTLAKRRTWGDAMPVVYIDVVWLVNFVMDGVLLATTGWIVKRPLHAWRIAAGALVGSLYALLLFLPSLSALTTWPGKAIVSLVMVGLAIPCRNWLDLARTSAMYYLVAFLFAGAAIALHFAVPGVSIGKATVVSGNRLAYVTSLKSLALLVAIPVSIALLRFAQQRVREIKHRQSALTRLCVEIEDRAVDLVGLVDTGNQLRDPVSRNPVCMVEAKVFSPLLPEPLRRAIDTDMDMLEAVADIHDASWARRISLVPYHTAGGSQRIAIGIRPDKVSLVRDDGLQPVKVRCLFALQTNRLSMDGRFQAILHTELMTEDERFERDWFTAERQPEAAHTIATPVDQNSTDAGGRS